MTATPETVHSADGTRIAFDARGKGAPVILIGGAFNDRTTVAGLAEVLADDFTTIAYDRRGRGDSGDAEKYEVEREIEDVAALIEHVGGHASLFGHSSGAVLALEVTARGLPVDKLAVYEPPFATEGHPRGSADLADRMRDKLAEDDRDAVVEMFLNVAGLPAEALEGMKAGPTWGWFTRLAHTLPYDVTVCGPGGRMPVERLAKIAVPTLVIGGGTSPDALPAAALAVAGVIPGARHHTLEGQDHSVLQQPESLRELLTGFFH